MCTAKSFFVFTLGSDFCRTHNRSIGTENSVFCHYLFQLCEQILFHFHFFQYTFYNELSVLYAFALHILCKADLGNDRIHICFCHNAFFYQQFHIIADFRFYVHRKYIIYCNLSSV